MTIYSYASILMASILLIKAQQCNGKTLMHRNTNSQYISLSNKLTPLDLVLIEVLTTYCINYSVA